MNDLVQVAVNADGGLERWNQLKTVKASVSITGAIWQLKGKPDVQERERKAGQSPIPLGNWLQFQLVADIASAHSGLCNCPVSQYGLAQ
jgi:hypothetical protein